jgi:hypothetical protein
VSKPELSVAAVVDMIESAAHRAGCCPECLCGQLVKVPEVARELDKRIATRDLIRGKRQ